MAIKQIYYLIRDEYLTDETSTFKSLSNKYGVSVSSISNNFRKLGVPLRKTFKSEKWKRLEEQIEYMYTIEHKDFKTIQKELSVPQRNLLIVFQERGYDTPHSDYTLIEDTTIDENYFEIIDTEHKAYWLGFIMADGCVDKDKNNFCIELNMIDLIHLKKFRNDINSSKPIIKRKDRDMCSIRICSKKLVSDLIRLGCVQDKTNNGFIPNEIINNTQNIKLAYLRGYLDGDGYIDKTRHRIIYTVKTEYVSNQLADLINNLLDTNFKLRPEKSYYRVLIENKNDFFIFLNEIYNNATIFLNRKYEIFIKRTQPSQEETLVMMSAELSGELLPNLYEPNGNIIC